MAGLSIEDSTGDPASPLYDLPIAVERVRAARRAIDRSGPSGNDVLLTARAEGSVAGLASLVPYAEINDLFTREGDRS